METPDGSLKTKSTIMKFVGLILFAGSLKVEIVRELRDVNRAV